MPQVGSLDLEHHFALAESLASPTTAKHAESLFLLGENRPLFPSSQRLKEERYNFSTAVF